MSQDRAEHEVDIVVVGAGAGGMTAAITAAAQGAEVLLLEKDKVYGGTSAMSAGGIWIPCSPEAQARTGDTPQAALDYMKALIGESAPDAKLRAFVDAAPRLLAFLQTETEVKFDALDYPDYHPDVTGGRQGWRSLEAAPFYADQLGEEWRRQRPLHAATMAFGRFHWTMKEARALFVREPGAMAGFVRIVLRYFTDFPWRLKTRLDRRLTFGAGLVGRLRRELQRRKVPLWLAAPMQRLLIEDGEVRGLVALHEGREVTIRARKGVILATGGFERSEELRQQHLPKPTSATWTLGNPNSTGDALAAAAPLAPQLGQMDWAWWTPGVIMRDAAGAPTVRPLFIERALPGCIIVSQTGQRYMNEASSYHVAGAAMYARHQEAGDAAPSWVIFDGRFRRRYPLGPLLPGSPAQDKRLDPSLKEALFKAASLEELARGIGVAPEVLTATVGRFNAFAEKGEDPDFGRGASFYDRYLGDARNAPNPSLAPITEAPFYALRIHPCDMGTNGGLVTDEFGRVLGQAGAIPGLYATGNCTAAVMGRAYPGPGSTIASAMTFGYLAARHATGANS